MVFGFIGDRKGYLFRGGLSAYFDKKRNTTGDQGYTYDQLYDEGTSSAEHKANGTAQEYEIEAESH